MFPLILHKKDGAWVLSAEGVNLIRPLFINNIAKKTKKRLEKTIIKTIFDISKKLNINVVKVFEFDDKLSTWYLLWLDKANKVFVTHHLMIDLEPSLEEIKSGFRKSYKPLVNKALREYDISACQEDIESLFEEFRLLHLHIAGKQTRSLKSWKDQQELIENDEAFLVSVRDKDTLVGAGFFTYTKDIGSYSVGAYKRELHNKSIGHGVQMKAIEFLKKQGCKKYYIGQKITQLDIIQPTDKEVSISHFKEGFASSVLVHPCLEIRINE